jgi:probable F420-dependent oxidoreductase
MSCIGLSTIPSHYTIPPVELGPWLEAHGFESVWFGEHSHIPTRRDTPFLVGGELPEYYKHFFDPFIGLTAVAAVTQKLRLGTGICVVTEHHPINLAKMTACLDQVSKGRLLLGIGAGWNAEEMLDYGVNFKDRWAVTRESILAMREIWTKDEPEYHGAHIKFPPMWCWPKPVQTGGPPVLLGAASKFVPERVADYCDGWMPVDLGSDLAASLQALRIAIEKKGRAFEDVHLTVLTKLEMAGTDALEGRIRELFGIGFKRVLLRLPTETPDKQWPLLESYARLLRNFN